MHLDKSIIKTKTCQYIISVLTQICNEYQLAIEEGKITPSAADKMMIKKVDEINDLSKSLKMNTYKRLNL